MYKHILVATDGSELADKAVAHALELAAGCGAELIAATVVPRYASNYFDGMLPLSEDEIKRIEERWQHNGEQIVRAIEDAARPRGVKCRGLVLRGDVVANALIEAAHNEHADLIVMASHGRKGVTRLLLGSETQQVLTRSEIPVLVLR